MAGGSDGSDTAESKPEAGVSVEDPGEDGCGDGGGSWVDLAGTLTGRLQWGHSILARAFAQARFAFSTRVAMSSVLCRSMTRIESCDALIRVYDDAGNVIENAPAHR